MSCRLSEERTVVGALKCTRKSSIHGSGGGHHRQCSSTHKPPPTVRKRGLQNEASGTAGQRDWGGTHRALETEQELEPGNSGRPQRECTTALICLVLGSSKCRPPPAISAALRKMLEMRLFSPTPKLPGQYSGARTQLLKLQLEKLL